MHTKKLLMDDVSIGETRNMDDARLITDLTHASVLRTKSVSPDLPLPLAFPSEYNDNLILDKLL